MITSKSLEDNPAQSISVDDARLQWLKDAVQPPAPGCMPNQMVESYHDVAKGLLAEFDKEGSQFTAVSALRILADVMLRLSSELLARSAAMLRVGKERDDLLAKVDEQAFKIKTLTAELQQLGRVVRVQNVNVNDGPKESL